MIALSKYINQSITKAQEAGYDIISNGWVDRDKTCLCPFNAAFWNATNGNIYNPDRYHASLFFNLQQDIFPRLARVNVNTQINILKLVNLIGLYDDGDLNLDQFINKIKVLENE